jgi:hypothetical protein
MPLPISNFSFPSSSPGPFASSSGSLLTVSRSFDRSLDLFRLCIQKKITSPKMMIMNAAPTAIPALAPPLKPIASPVAGGLGSVAELWAVGLEFGVLEPGSTLEAKVAEEIVVIDIDGMVVGDDVLELIDVNGMVVGDDVLGLIDAEVLKVELAAVLLAARLAAFNVPHWLPILFLHWSCPVWSLGLSAMQSAYDCSQIK